MLRQVSLSSVRYARKLRKVDFCPRIYIKKNNNKRVNAPTINLIMNNYKIKLLSQTHQHYNHHFT